MINRGTNEHEVQLAVREGEETPAKKGRIAFKKTFPFNDMWKNRFYTIKQVMPIVAEEENRMVVVTVYVFFVGAQKHEDKI